jgi:hypothetical protein
MSSERNVCVNRGARRGFHLALGTHYASVSPDRDAKVRRWCDSALAVKVRRSGLGVEPCALPRGLRIAGGGDLEQRAVAQSLGPLRDDGPRRLDEGRQNVQVLKVASSPISPSRTWSRAVARRRSGIDVALLAVAFNDRCILANSACLAARPLLSQVCG